MNTRSKLIEDIEHFIASNDFDATEFGWKSVRNASLVKNLRSGGDVTTGTMDKIYAFMDSYSKQL